MIEKIPDKFFGLWDNSKRTGQKAVRGSFLIFFVRLSIKFIYFIKTIILARLLFPDDLGLFGIAVLVMNLTEVLFQSGFNSAIIQEKRKKNAKKSSHNLRVGKRALLPK